MKEQSEWIPYKELDWEDEENNVFSIDTRDFYAGYRFEKKSHPDFSVLKNYPDRFFHTKEEVEALLDRYFNESGGIGKWRMFSLETADNWEMKYIRIWRTSIGFIICSQHNKALKKSILALSVQQTYLNHY